MISQINQNSSHISASFFNFVFNNLEIVIYHVSMDKTAFYIYIYILYFQALLIQISCQTHVQMDVSFIDLTYCPFEPPDFGQHYRCTCKIGHSIFFILTMQCPNSSTDFRESYISLTSELFPSFEVTHNHI